MDRCTLQIQKSQLKNFTDAIAELGNPDQHALFELHHIWEFTKPSSDQ